ncbi:hypothetical protein MHYP_G00061980 [Metynnis hypsauchen]
MEIKDGPDLKVGAEGHQQWGVTYTAERICALKGSSVHFSCTYEHPEGLTVTRSLWFIGSLNQSGVEPEDVGESDQYKGRVQYSRTLNSCRMTITDLRESDAHTYSFRFYTEDPGGRYSGRPGVSLSITDLKVTVSDTDGGDKKLTCSSTCTLPNNPTYIWYKNGQPVSECGSASCPVAVVSEAVSYSCAVKGSDLHSPPVYSPRPPSVSETEVNGSVTLVCVSDSNPASSYTWFRKTGGDITQFGEGASLTLAAGADGVFYCTAENLLGSSTSSGWTFKKDLKVTVSDTDGGDKKLTCSSTCILPNNPTYIWYKNGQPVSQCGSASCSVAVVSEAVSYSCAVKGSDLHSPPVYSPRPPSVSETEVNGSVTLVCVSDSNPASSYTWFRKTGGDITQFGEGASLTLAAGADGVFYCTAENLLGSSTSSGWTFKKDLKVTVSDTDGGDKKLTCSSTCTLPNNPTYIWYKNGQPVSECGSASCPVAVVSEAVSYSCAVKGSDLHSPPVYSPKTTRAVILPSGQRAEGDSVTLTCSSDADPPVLSYSWFNQSSDVELGTGQSYSITSISSQHSGLYYCTAQNQLGQSRSEPSRLDVLYSPRPPSVSETEVNGSVTLVCVSDSNPASSYTWFRKTGGDITRFGEGASLTLAAGADGVFYCTAENLLGSSNSSGWTLTSGVLWAPKSGDDTYSALNPNTTSPDYDTLTPVRDSPSDTYSALNPETRTSDYDALTAPKSGDETYSALNPNTMSPDYDTLTVVRPHPVMRRAPENEN